MADGVLEKWLYKCVRKSDGCVRRVHKFVLPEEIDEIEKEVIRDLRIYFGGEWVCEERFKVRE